jgi:hypothetical protein
VELRHESNVIVMPPPDDWARLIRKLRSIGLEKEADRLQSAVRALPPEQRDTDCVRPRDAD